MIDRVRISMMGALCAFVVLLPVLSSAAPVDLSTWTAESYPAVSGFGAGVWSVAPGGDSVTQSVNGQPTLFYSDFNAQGSDVRGFIRVNSGGDDDYIGFALGFRPNDSTNGAADYLLVDWKQGTQFFDFGAPSNTPGSNAPAGLAVSRVTGIPTADEFWGHTNFVADPAGGLAELQRGATRGNIGYSDLVTYEFRFIFEPNRLRVYVDGGLELDVAGAFSDGRMAFYNFSQADVTYSAFTRDPAPPGEIPEPSTALLIAPALIGVAVFMRRKSRSN